ncbi:MAG: hypothetical protein QXJ84_01145 [Desulfurococcaceae archaeon]
MNAESRVLLTMLKYRRMLLGELLSLTGYSGEVVTHILERYSDAIRIQGEEVVAPNPLLLALKLLSMNVELRKVSELLDWRDFEVFSSNLLSEAGYDVVHGLRITSPVRFEIDVFAVEPSTGFSIAVDCKHWSSRSPSRLMEAATRHSERVSKMIKHYLLVRSKYKMAKNAKYVVPLVITLLTPTVRAHDGVLLLSIRELPHFLAEKYEIIEYFEIKPIKIAS